MKTSKILAVITAVLALAGCMKNSLEEGNRRDIHFGAVAPKSNLTKTVYSYHQETVESEPWERIDWVDNDLIQIMSPQVSDDPDLTFFDYDIKFDVNEALKSFASALPHGAEHGLQWQDKSVDYTFFSFYPSPTTSGAEAEMEFALTGAGSANAVAVIPANQSPIVNTTQLDDTNEASYYGNMKLAYMTAAVQVPEGTENVTLSFKPMVTTFFVNIINTTGKKMTLQQVKLTSAANAMTGKYRLSMTKDNTRPGNYRYWNGSTWATSPDKTDDNASVYADMGGLEMAADQSITVALFALPHSITELTLTVTADETGPINLPLKYNDSFIEFAGEKKHNISNINVPGVSYFLDVDPVTLTYDYTGTYTPDEQEFTVTSSKTIGSTVRDVPWKTQVWVDDDGDGVQDDEEWRDLADEVDASGAFPWLSNFPTTSAAAVDEDEDANATTSTYQKTVSAQDVVSHEERLRNGIVYDVDGSPLTHDTPGTAIDLSKYDFVTRKMETDRYTANTYIISAPGYYKIPIVFGNAIEKNQTVPDSYNGDTGLGHLNYFICPTSFGSESSIHLVSTRPWLNESRSRGARIHWEKYSYWDPNEGTDGEMVTYHRGWSETAPVSVIDDLSIQTGTGNERFIVFHVDEENIRPGNWCIASMSKADGTGNVCWSWQIWITDQDMTPVSIYNGTRTYSLLPVNLGWTDLSKGQHYDAREAVLRFASTEKTGLYSTHTLTVKQKEEDVLSTKGWSTFYQWGRKDPMTDGPTSVYQNDGMVHESIKHPSNIMWDKSSELGDRYFDWTVNNYNNLWDSRNDDWASPSDALPNHKTVYDPSPRRYCVPPDKTFDGFTSYSSASLDGIFFPTGVGANTVFFPAAGIMNYTSAQSSKGNDVINAYWTYHPGENAQRRSSYAMHFTYNTASSSATVSLQDYNLMDRSYGYSVRPIAYDESAVVTESEGTFDTVFNFQEMWGDGTNVSGLTPSNLDGFSTNTPSSAETGHTNDISISFVSERDVAYQKIRYEYDSSNEYYALVLPGSYDGAFLNHFNRFTISTNNPNLYIVQITLTQTQKGVGITTDSPMFDASEAIWSDSAATYDKTTETWSGGKQSVQFTMNSGTGNPWKVAAITVTYYVTE